MSCIIPTYNRSHYLHQAIESLQKQTFDTFEIIVVDNAADPAIKHMIATFNATATIPVRYLPEPNLGVHNARHTGALAATGELLVFTDDDTTFAPQWIEAYAQAFSIHPEMAASGGPVRPLWESPPPEWLMEYIGDARIFTLLSLMEPYQKIVIDTKGYFFSCNMAIWKTILIDRGGFHPEATGNIWLGDGETGLNQEMWNKGDLIGYVPEAIVYHHIPSSRMTVKYFCHRMANEGACDMYAAYHKGIPGQWTLLKHAMRIVLERKCWIRPLLYRGKTDHHSLNIQMYAARTQAHVKYILRLMRDKKFRQLVLRKDWLHSTAKL